MDLYYTTLPWMTLLLPIIKSPHCPYAPILLAFQSLSDARCLKLGVQARVGRSQGGQILFEVTFEISYLTKGQLILKENYHFNQKPNEIIF